MWVIFVLLDPDPDSGSTDPIKSGSNPDTDTDPDPQPCRLKRRFVDCRSPQKRLFVSGEQDLEDSPCSNAAAARMMEDDTLDDDVQVKMTRQIFVCYLCFSYNRRNGERGESQSTYTPRVQQCLSSRQNCSPHPLSRKRVPPRTKGGGNTLACG